MTATLHPDTAATLEALREVAGLVAARDDARHRAGKWTVSQILEHLQKTYASSAYILGRCAERGIAKGGRPTVKNRVETFIVLGVGYMPTGVPAPEFSRPGDEPAADVAGQAEGALRDFNAAAAAAKERLGDRVRVANHPVLGPFTIRQWRRFHLVHTRHHLKQARLPIA